MIEHSASCGCAYCRAVSAQSVEVTREDCQLLGAEWARWISTADGEAAKLARGEQGNPGSPRWVALQAIARARIAASVRQGEAA